MVDLICRRCGTDYSVPLNQAERSRYCSTKCRAADAARWMSRPLAERFWEKVDKRGPDECWPWIGATTWGGYGVIGLGRKQLLRAPRVSYEMHKGTIPKGNVIRHTCDNPICVNPDHLLTGTRKDNHADARSRDRLKGAKRKLTDKQVAEIRQRSGTVRELAAEYGVSPAVVSLIKRGLRR